MPLVNSDALQDRWKDGWLPAINGIVLSSGVIRWLETANVAFQSASVSAWPVRELADEQNIRWIRVSEFCELVDYRAGIGIGCGETSWEGEGFVVVTDVATNQLRWAAVLQNVGPFINAACIDGIAWAANESNEWVGIDVQDPQAIHGVSQHKLGLVRHVKTR